MTATCDQPVGPDAARGDPRPPFHPAETELQFFSRRAMEESRAAARAACPQAAAAHRYLAAAYAGLVRSEIDVAAQLDAFVRQLD